MSDEELVEQGRAVERDLSNGFPMTCEKGRVIQEMASRIEQLVATNKALTEQLKTVLDREAATTARYDAKTDELEDKLAKAVEGLRGFMSKVDTACLVERDHPQVEFADAWREAYGIIATAKL